MKKKKLSRRKFLGFVGVGLVTLTAASLPIKALARISESSSTADADPLELPKEPGVWGDAISDIELELPQDPNVILMDVDEIYKLNQ